MPAGTEVKPLDLAINLLTPSATSAATAHQGLHPATSELLHALPLLLPLSRLLLSQAAVDGGLDACRAVALVRSMEVREPSKTRKRCEGYAFQRT